MSNPNPPLTLTVGLGFDGELRLLFPNGKSIDLPKGDAEARMREILQGFKRPLAAYRQEVREREYTEIPPGMEVRRYGKPIRLARELTLKDLGLE